MLEPSEPSRSEVFYRRVQVASWLLLVVAWAAAFVHIGRDARFSAVLLLFVLAFAATLAAKASGRQASRLAQERRDAYARLVLNAARVGAVPEYGVYLRPFYVTGQIQQKESSSIDGNAKWAYEFESTLTAELANWMPIVALGRPGEAIGAGRVLSSDGTWKADAAELMRSASLIICIPSAHHGTAWELEQIVQNGYLAKTVFFMPIALRSYSSLQAQRGDWNAVTEFMARHGISLPDPGGVSPMGRSELSFALASVGHLLRELKRGRLRVGALQLQATGLLFLNQPDGGRKEEYVDIRRHGDLRGAIERLIDRRKDGPYPSAHADAQHRSERAH